jgi:RHS repeat-associated protein
MRIDSTLYYTLKDHLGSASVVTNASGATVGEQRYYPFGETRLTTGSIFTDKLFTGQREMSGLGIYHFNARFYSPKIGRFLSADTIVPSMANPQSFNRYSYVNNSPLNYTDPSGNRPCDERDGCTVNAKPQARCSVGEGYFNGSFKCTAADLNKVSIAKRKAWLNEMLASVDAGLPEQFANLNSILKAFDHTNTGAPGSWASWGDAGILNSIQNGLARATEQRYIPGFKPADQAWKNYTISFFSAPESNITHQLWGAAEGLGTRYGRLLASENGQSKTFGEVLFLGVGDIYRNSLAHYNPNAIQTDVVREITSFVFDPASTFGETDITSVQLVAELLLRIK